MSKENVWKKVGENSVSIEEKDEIEETIKFIEDYKFIYGDDWPLRMIHGEHIQTLLSSLESKDKEIERLKEGLDHAPFHSYGEALREGCDADGAWECFKEDYRRHVGILLKEAK